MVDFTTSNEDIIENWDGPVDASDKENLSSLLQVMVSENKRIDLELETLYDQRFVQTATGKELEKLGDPVGVDRKTGEGDSKLRKRILGGYISQASDGTYSAFATAALTILDCEPESVSIKRPHEVAPKQIELHVDGSVIEANPLTQSELQVLLNGALSVDAGLTIIAGGTFAFAGDDPSLEGFDEGTWSSSLN